MELQVEHEHKQPMYLALGDKGEYWREARIVGELPSPTERLHAIKRIEAILPDLLNIQAANNKHVHYGLPAFSLFGMRPADAKKHKHADILMTPGHELPLTLLNATL